ncbi:amidohydrolase family protein [bacterium]|nr:amidohydrolase family protein [bacterium]
MGNSDYIIKGGRVFDGCDFLEDEVRGAPRCADVALKDGRIAAIGKFPENSGKIIDASGCIVSPGFIDVHTHCDLAVMSLIGARRARPGGCGISAPKDGIVSANLCYLRQGVTTVVTGNCGLGEAGCRPWFDYLDENGFGTNVVHLVPHGMLRMKITGKTQGGKLSSGDIQKLRNALENEMAAGAAGFSSGLEYAPGCFADIAELEVLARTAAERGGIYATHLRNETGEGVEEALGEAIEVARSSGVSLEISHLKITAPLKKGLVCRLLAMIERSRDEGIDICADQYCYDYGSTYITWLVNPIFLDGNIISEKCRDASSLSEISAGLLKKLNFIPPDKIIVSSYGKCSGYEGKTLTAIGEETSREAVDVLMELVLSKDPPLGMFLSQDMGNVREIMKKDYVLTSSDGWTQIFGEGHPHPRNYGNFPRKIKRFVRGEKIISLGHALRSMTSLPAEKFRLNNRGRIKKGFAADIAVFREERFCDKSSVENPHAYAEGLDCLFVNGKLSISGGVFTGVKAGRILKNRG